MKKYFIFLLFCCQGFSQETSKTDSITISNPIVFAEIFGGLGGGSSNIVVIWGLNMNYQFNKKDLITFRYSSVTGFKVEAALVAPFLALPVSIKRETQNEYAFLYGKRWVDSNFSISISAGASYTERDYYRGMLVNNSELSYENYFGLPYEVSIKWFKSKKSVFRAYYGIIPIGKKKVGFGRSFGLKITGNVAKTSYIGFGISYGFGWHKNYYQ